ncbi:MAG: sigma-70 family RNA polymerase sigma factor, partial [Planctomycetes bacterium]|nr:sigma-70 family RNA polymerase sigma factor [Planctomycetota bacterium]
MKDTDLELLQRFTQTHDADAFSQIVARYRDFVYGTCVRVLDDPVGAEDAAQECFMKLLQKADTVRSSLAGWLHDCATGISIDAVRRRALRKDKEHASSRMNSSANNDNRWHNVSPRLDKALEELPDDLRVVVVEHFLQRRTQTEIARQLGVSPATVSRRADSGIEEVRKTLKRAGVIVSGALLASLITEHAAFAAPASLTAALGKIAVAGVNSDATASWTGTGVVAGAMTTAGKVKIAAVVVAALAVGWVVAQEIADKGDLLEDAQRIVLTRGEDKVTVDAPDEVQAFLSAIALVPKEICACAHFEQVVFEKGEEKLSASICDHCLDIRTSDGVKHYKMPKPFYDLFQKHMRPKDKEADRRAVVEGNNAFAFDLYAKLKDTDGNLFLSPFSISTALAMTSAGARGNTATQMVKVLRLDLAQG